MYITKKNKYVDSIIDFINDTKPYHCKLTEVIHEYQFSDTLNVHLTDYLFTKTKLSSVWDKAYVSNGHRDRYIIPTYTLPRYSLESNRHHFNSTDNAIPYLKNVLQLDNAFRLRASHGIESVITENSLSLAEGIDYHVSKGMYSFNISTTDNNKYWSKLDTPSIPKNGNLVHYPEKNVQISNLTINPVETDTWTIESIYKSHTYTITTPSTVWDITHNLNSSDFVYELFINDGPLLKNIKSDIIIIDPNNIRINFPVAYSGKIHLLIVPNAYKFNIDNANTNWKIIHNFNTSKIVIQAAILDNGILTTVAPQSINILNKQEVEIIFSTPRKGNVYIIPNKDTSTVEFDIPTTVWSIPLIDIGGTGIPIFNVYSQSGNTYSAITPNEVKVENTNLVITFNTAITKGCLSFIPTQNFGWYNIFSKLHGYLGTASNIFRYNHNSLSFDINDIPNIRAKTLISTRANTIVIHPDAPEETWSLIKVNPFNYHQLTADYTGLTKVDVIAHTWPASGQSITDPGFEYLVSPIDRITPPWSIHVTNNTDTTHTFEVFFLDISQGTYTINTAGPTASFDVNNQLHFVLTFGDRKIKVGDSYSFGFGYDADVYDFSGYDNAEYTQLSNRGTSFYIEPSSKIRAIPLAAAYTSAVDETWIFTFNEVEGNFSVEGTVSGPSPKAWLGKEYDNDKIRLRLVRTAEAFNIFKNSGDYRDQYLAGAISNDELKHGDKFYFVIEKEKSSYLVHGSISGYTKPAIIGKYYWNGKIGFYLPKPKYKVHIGEYNQVLETGTAILPNGTNITFNSAPKVDAFNEQFKLVFHHDAYINSKLEPVNTVKQFLLYSSLRGQLPAVRCDQRYTELENAENQIENSYLIDITITDNIFPSNYEFYIDILSNQYKGFHSHGVIIIPNLVANTNFRVNTFQEDLLTITVNAEHPELGSTTRLIPTYVLPAIEYSLGYDGHVSTIPLTKAVPIQYTRNYIDEHGITKSELVTINSVTSEFVGTEFVNFEYELYDYDSYDTDGSYGIAGQIDGVDYTSNHVYNINKPVPTIPDRGRKFDVWFKNVKDIRLGSITWQYDPDADFYRQVIDLNPDFVKKYLTLNTAINFNVAQADQYNDLLKVLIGEDLETKIIDYANDTITVTTVDLFEPVINENHNGASNTIATTVSDNTLSINSGIPTGYDVAEYDGTDVLPNYYDIYLSNTVSYEIFTPDKAQQVIAEQIEKLIVSIVNFPSFSSIELWGFSNPAPYSQIIPTQLVEVADYTKEQNQPTVFTFMLNQPQPLLVKIIS